MNVRVRCLKWGAPPKPFHNLGWRSSCPATLSNCLSLTRTYVQLDVRVRCLKWGPPPSHPKILSDPSLLVSLVPLPTHHQHTTVRPVASARKAGVVQMNGVGDAMQSYVNIWSPTIRTLAADANINPALIKWFHVSSVVCTLLLYDIRCLSLCASLHSASGVTLTFFRSSFLPIPDPKGANMGILLTTMASFGAYLGWQIRKGDGEMEFTGKTARELHPTLMGVASLLFFLGGQGGLVLLDVQGQPILNSTHAVTGLVGIALLALQGLLPKLFDGESGATARTAHAYLGSATMALLFVHAGFGLQLGFSF